MADDRDTESVQDALTDFYERNGYGADGGASARWVKATMKPLPISIYFPNFEARRQALRLHDIHHLATGYETDLTGEAQIAAWEIGGSCVGYWAAWMLNFSAFCYGWIVLPRRVFRAFVRGRHTRNLYHEPWRDEFVTSTVARIRSRLGLDQPPPVATAADVAAYLGLVLVAVITVAGALGVVAAGLLMLLSVLRG